MSRLVRPTRLLALTAGAVLGTSLAFAPAASALTVTPGGVVVSPAYCGAVYGDPSPCPPPDRPEPITDPSCLRVDISPRHCPWLP